MKTKTFALLFLIGLMIGCQQNKPVDNPDVLKQVLIDYYDGIKDHDFDKMKAVTTSDFMLFEDGKVWNNDSLINFLNSFPGYKAVFKFDNFTINVDKESGNMYYFNHLDMTINDTTEMVFDWLESATFKKIDSKWKMNFLHSTVRK